VSPFEGSDEPSTGASVPRWMAFILLLVGMSLAHGVAPWAMSLLTRRYGWIGGRPGIFNVLGLVVVLFGAAGLIWIVMVAFDEAPETIQITPFPSRLLMRGPYAYTRNPMYGAELGLWFGWALWYGSVAVFSGFVAFWAVVTLVVVPWEERWLEARFGESYREYKAKRPRWV
jgi:protein-S-isoprenylcysteine O-methyltransferase Ste14